MGKQGVLFIWINRFPQMKDAYPQIIHCYFVSHNYPRHSVFND